MTTCLAVSEIHLRCSCFDFSSFNSAYECQANAWCQQIRMHIPFEEQASAWCSFPLKCTLMTKAFSFWFGSKISILGKKKIRGCFGFFFNPSQSDNYSSLPELCQANIYAKWDIKDCQNCHQSSMLCCSNQSQFLEGRRREREYKLSNQLFCLLQILFSLLYKMAFCYLQVIAFKAS